MNEQQSPILDTNQVIAERREKLAALRATGNPYPNRYTRRDLAGELAAKHGERTPEALEADAVNVRIAGRMMLKRVMGKASFATLQDMSGQIQIYVTDSHPGEAAHEAFKHYDLGDILGVEGVLFKTKKGELTVRVHALELLTKSLRPLPEKFHGLADQELKYRQRYVDLIMSADTRQRFVKRTRAIQALREFLAARGYLEVETPMM
jgi:lysyl-tRNA synthetase, class II